MKRMESTNLALAITLVATTAALVILFLAVSGQPSLAWQSQLQAEVGPQAASSTTYVALEFASGIRSARRITWTTAPSRTMALILAGFDVEYDKTLGTVCSINGEGCPASDCFCPDNWWANAVWKAGAWDTSFPPPPVQDGDVLGFRNGPPPAAWGPPQWPAPRYEAVAKGLEYLRPLQSAEDGSYPSAFGKMGPTTDQVFAVVANAQDADQWRRGATSPSLTDYMKTTDASAYADKNAASAGKLGVALAAADSISGTKAAVCWPAFGMKVGEYYSPTTGAYYPGTDREALTQAWAMLGLVALSDTVPLSATNALSAMVNTDGGWPFDSGFSSDSDPQTTALAMQALLATGVPTHSAIIQNGLTYLKNIQNKDGGFPYSAGGDSDVNSTAFAIQAIVATDGDPITGTWRTLSGTVPMSPISYVLSIQLPDGSFPAYSPMMATQLAIPALLERPLPLATALISDCWTTKMFLPVVSKNH